MKGETSPIPKSNMAQLLISIDPGFDSVKVIANGQHFKFPFNSVETDERKMSDYGTKEGFILYKDITGATWRVGSYARCMTYENKLQDFSDFYSEQRFVSSEFLVGIRSAIAMAIKETNLYSHTPHHYHTYTHTYLGGRRMGRQDKIYCTWQCLL